MQFIIGDFGHLSVILALVSAWVAAFSYTLAEINSQENNQLDISQNNWLVIGKWAFCLHFLSVIAVFSTLFVIVYTHDYRFHYAWAHSSNNLPIEYMISCFWEGQEGSFLLWIFWHAILLGIFQLSKSRWKTGVFAISMAVQGFLISMILGSQFGEVVKIGSSPFILMKEAMANLPIYAINPDFVPEDGRGLNPLLQNYWMVIHPPTLFLGFALTLFPFSYAITGLWRKEYKAWIKPSLVWTLIGAGILGLGIMMGAYWAYETLNFGGYWNWDPVENAVYIPWLIGVASIHTMITAIRSGRFVRTSLVLSISTFLLILYATFLTRSGILGNASVHSFTDLGLSGQLLVYLLTFTILSIWLLGNRWQYIPSKSAELSVNMAEFWIFLGVLTLVLASFQVASFTSIPVYNAIGLWFGLDLGMAPPADQMATYSSWQLWFALATVIIAVTGQLFWYKRGSLKEQLRVLQFPVLISLVISASIIAFMKVDKLPYISLVAGTVYAVVMSLQLFVFVLKSKLTLSAGTVAHTGLALMLIGILFSSGYSKVLSTNTSGLIYRKEFTEELNRDNVLLWRGTPTPMGDFTLTYKGDCYGVRGFPTYVKKPFLAFTENPYKMVALAALEYGGRVYYKKGDTVLVEPENTFYAVEYLKSDSSRFMLYPRAQVNPSMGLLASPDVYKTLTSDLYSHVSSVPKPDDEKEWSTMENFDVRMGDTLFMNDYVAQLVSVSPVEEVSNIKLGQNDLGVKATIRVLGIDQNYIAEPVFLVKDQEVGKMPFDIPELGLRITLEKIDPMKQLFTLGVMTSQKDWIILKVMEKPWINLVWVGTLVILAGFGLAFQKRYSQSFK